jgi:hypothetical protein
MDARTNIDPMERYRQNFFAEHEPIYINDLQPGMKIIVPDDPLDYGGGDVFMEVTRLNVLSNGQISIVGKLTHVHVEIGKVGNDVVALSPFDQVGKQ